MTAKELIARTLTNAMISRSGKANAENAAAAPILARMLEKAISQRDMAFENCGNVLNIVKRDDAVKFLARSLERANAELDAIAAGREGA